MGSFLLPILALVAPLVESGPMADPALPGPGNNPWGPAATRARGTLPAVPLDPATARWDRWGRSQLRDGDLVFRLGDARTLRGFFPLSWYIARATGSRYSHV